MSYADYKFGVFGTFSGLFNSLSYNPEETSREEFFKSLNQPLPGRVFYAVAIEWGSNTVSRLSEESAIDPLFLVGSFLGMIAILVGQGYALFMVWVAYHDAEKNQRETFEELKMRLQFDSSAIELRKQRKN